MKLLLTGCAVLAGLLFVGCGPTQIPELTMKAEYQPSMSVKGANGSKQRGEFIAFKEKGDSQKIEVLYSFGGSMYLQRNDELGNPQETLIGKSIGPQQSFDIIATFPSEFEKYAEGGFNHWEITPIPPTEALYLYSKEEQNAINTEYKTAIFDKGDKVQIIPGAGKIQIDKSGNSQTKNAPRTYVDLAMKDYTVPPAAFQIEAFSELRNIPGEYDKIRSGYGLVKFLYPWRIQFKFFAYPADADNHRKYQDLRGTRDWIDAIMLNEKGISGEKMFRIPVLLPVRPDNLKIGMALRLVFNTDYPDDVMVYPDDMKTHLYEKISWRGADKITAQKDPDFMAYRWNIAVIDELIRESCQWAFVDFSYGNNNPIKLQVKIDISDMNKDN